MKKSYGMALGTGGFVLLLCLCAGNSLLFCVGMALAGSVAGFLLPLWQASRKKQRESRMITMDMAEYLTCVSLLLTAGVSLWDALRRSLSGKDVRRPLYRELSGAFEQYEQGYSGDPVSAFQRMSEKLCIPAVSTFVCALVQNYKKGNQELATLFMELAVRSRTQRRDLATKLADEATTLLLLPGAMALIAMILVLLAPALIQLIQL